MEGFKEEQKGKEKSFCFILIKIEFIFGHPCFDVVCYVKAG